MNPEQFSALRQHHLLAALDDSQFAHIGSTSQLQTLDAGQMLFQRGDAADHFYIVLSGQLTLCLRSRSGDEKIVATLSPGQAFAEALMFGANRSYPVSAVATLKTTLVAIPNAEFLAMLRASNETCLRLLGDLSWRLHSHIREIEALSFENARNRVAHHLLDLAGNTSGPATVTLTETKQALAARLAIKPETLSRTLRALADSGGIEMDGRQIRIPDPSRLRQPL